MSEGGSAAIAKKPKPKKDSALWLTSFSDLSFVLMCFFALQLSMSTLDKNKFDKVSEAFETTDKRTKSAQNLADILKLINEEIKRRKLERYISAKLDTNGLAVEFSSSVLFESGSAELNPKFETISGQITDILSKAPKKYHLSVEGHTDDLGNHEANWMLSARRGVVMLYKFRSKGLSTDEMKVVAFGSSLPKIDPRGKKGSQLDAARAANRRVVIRLN